MNAFLRKMRLRHPFIVLMMTIFFLFTPGAVVYDYAQEEVASTSAQPGKIARNIRMVKLYTVQEGKGQHLIIGSEDLRKGQSIEVKGYVTGVLILSDSEMNISVDGEEMSKIGRNGDGTYSIKHFGKVGPGEIEAGSFTYYKESEKRRLPRGYSFFPKVLGDSVSSQERFRIELKTDEDSYALAVKQVPYCTIRCTVEETQASAKKAKDSLELQYLGCRLPNHMKLEDFDKRLDAISEGIRSVEKAFKVKLVDRVKIIDFEKVQNAVTCEEKNDIWFYIRTFLEEPLEELKIIAEHETIHILVDRMGFAKDPAIRELFSDLKGYDALSRERYALMTRGFASPVPDPEKVFVKFFAFIDERNFLEGMKGGHSSNNMDEFCTSYLHSLMYIDRLYRNLDKPLKLSKQKNVALLDEKEKTEIRDAYYKSMEAFLKARTSPRKGDSTHPFLLSCLNKALNMDGLKAAEYKHN